MGFLKNCNFNVAFMELNNSVQQQRKQQLKGIIKILILKTYFLALQDANFNKIFVFINFLNKLTNQRFQKFGTEAFSRLPINFSKKSRIYNKYGN